MKAITCLQPHKLQKWIRSPSDDRRLMEALLAAYRARSMSARKARPVNFPTGASRQWPSTVRPLRATPTATAAVARSARRRPRDSDSSKDRQSKKKEKEPRGKKGKKEDNPKEKKNAGKDTQQLRQLFELYKL